MFFSLLIRNQGIITHVSRIVPLIASKISHLGKRNIIFKHAFSGGYVSSLGRVDVQRNIKVILLPPWSTFLIKKKCSGQATKTNRGKVTNKKIQIRLVEVTCCIEQMPLKMYAWNKVVLDKWPKINGFAWGYKPAYRGHNSTCNWYGLYL